MENTYHTISIKNLSEKVAEITYREKIAMRIVSRGTTTSRTKSVYDFIPLATSGYAKSLLQKMLTTFKTSQIFSELDKSPICFELNNISNVSIYTEKEWTWFCNHFFPIVVSKSNLNEVFLEELLKNLDSLLECNHETKKNHSCYPRNQWIFIFEE